VSHSFFDRAIRRTLRRPAQPHSDPCPEANQLAEYIESRCSRAQRSKLEDHLAQCDPCQEVLALALKMDESDGDRESPTLAGAGERRILFRFSIPISALAAVVTIVGTILLVRPVWKSQVEEVVQTAQVSVPLRSDSDMRNPAPQDEKADKPAAQTPRKEFSKAASVPAAPPAESKEKKALEKAEDTKLAVVDAPPAQVSSEPAVAAGAREPAAAREQNLAAQNMTTLQQAGNRQFGAAQATGGMVGGVRGEIRATQDSATPKTEELVASFFKLDREMQEKLPRRTVSDRSFYQWNGYWIDGKCLENPGAPVFEISGNDAEFSELAEQLQELKGSPVVVFRLNRILILRAK
jgi:hypothetical protein